MIHMKTDNITSFVLGVVCFFGFITAYAELNTSEAPLNLLSNGSFEEGAYSPTDSPTDWARDAWQPSAVFTWDDSQARTGNKSVRIDAPVENDARWSQTVDLDLNTLYSLSGWIKTDNVDAGAGANLSLSGGSHTFTHSDGVFGTHEWIHNSIVFNSGSDTQLAIQARLGHFGATTSGTAWFDDLQLTPIVPMDPHPGWKILVLIYQETDFEVTDDNGIYHHYVASMTQDEMDQAAMAAKDFVEIDIPALTSGNMIPQITVRLPDRALTQLSPIGGGWWPSPQDTRAERDSAFDSVIVIWEPWVEDLTTNDIVWIGFGDGLTAIRGRQTYVSMQLDAAIHRGHRNVFKHEWGHSILFFYDAMGTAPKPTVSNHADATQYVNCQTGQFYVWQDETLANPIPNSIYNNESGFTHDYYSGMTATADQPTRCLGITPEAWAFGGPVSHSGNIPVLPVVNDSVTFAPDPSTYSFTRDTSGCPSGFIGKFDFEAQLNNVSQSTLSDLHVQVAELSNGNVLLTSEGTIGVDGVFPVPTEGGYSDALLGPAEYLEVPFTICLKNTKPFTFFVDVLGAVVPVPLSAWPFDEGSGTTVFDAVGANDGVVYGATWTSGVTGSALSFDGSDDYVEMLQPISVGAMTFSAWVKVPELGINNRRIYTLGVDGGHYYALQGNSGDALSAVVDGDEVNEFDWSFALNTWTQIAMSYDGNTIKVYKDGVMTETGTIPGTPVVGNLLIGGVVSPHPGARIWHGAIDEVMIFDRVLSDAEVSIIYSSGRDAGRI